MVHSCIAYLTIKHRDALKAFDQTYSLKFKVFFWNNIADLPVHIGVIKS